MVGRELEPDKKKWAGVEYGDENVRICWAMADGKTRGGKKFEPFPKEDLERLRAFSGPPRFRFALAGIGCSGATPMVSALTSYNQAKALLGRMFRLPAQREWGRGPKPGVWLVAERLADNILQLGVRERMPDEDWLKSMPARRQRPLRRGMTRYRAEGYQAQFEQFKCFVKTELLPGFGKGDCELTELKGMLDRNICGPEEEAHCIMGPEIKPVMYQLKQAWDWQSAVFYGSCKPADLTKFLQERLVAGQKLYFWCDFSMFDNTHSRESWAFMASLYRKVGIVDPDFWRMFEAWHEPKGRVGPFKFKGRTMNASGRDDTALANGVLNGVAMFMSLTAAWFKVGLFELTPEMLQEMKGIVDLSVCGDDSIGALPALAEEEAAEFFKRVEQCIQEFGFEAKLNYSRCLYDAVYLGCRPYPVGGRWWWGKTIGRATYKLGWVLLEPGRDLMAHITGIADMHCITSTHVPVLYDLAKQICMLREHCKRTPVVPDVDKPWVWTDVSGVEYDDSTIAAVAEMYSTVPTPGNPTVERCGVCPDDVRDLIRTIRNIRALPCVLDHWLWKRMVLVDDL